ncbi:MAG TPA: dephospho-CoA kinase [Candidatus Dormibacteraeota bacterium]|nr:dephospho-CoA kinase [Candidatus Dormibacteraeota bacterium]
MSRVIGLTGGIASGKSTVAERLSEKGAWIVDADQLARAVVAVQSPALAEIVESFGAEVIAGDGSLDRPQLGRLVFQDEAARERLNAIVHPRVLELSREEIRRAEAAGAELVVYDVPLLFETSREQEFEGTLVVWVDPLTQLLRLRHRSGLDEDEAKARIEAQLPLSRKRELATWTIDNSGSLEATRAAVDSLWEAELQPRR